MTSVLDFHSWGVEFFGGWDLGVASGASGVKVVVSGSICWMFWLVLASVAYSLSLDSIMASMAAFSTSRSSRVCLRTESSVRRSRFIILFKLWVAWRQILARLVAALFFRIWILLLWSLQLGHWTSLLVMGLTDLFLQELGEPSGWMQFGISVEFDCNLGSEQDLLSWQLWWTLWSRGFRKTSLRLRYSLWNFAFMGKISEDRKIEKSKNWKIRKIWKKKKSINRRIWKFEIWDPKVGSKVIQYIKP